MWFKEGIFTILSSLSPWKRVQYWRLWLFLNIYMKFRYMKFRDVLCRVTLI
jgi:hypothetical protein